MAGLKELRGRIASIQSTRKITRAMRMVAASKLRASQEAAESARPYAEGMRGLLAKLSSQVDAGGALASLPLFAGRGGAGKEGAGAGTHLFLVATADRGLCGGFNTSIARLARERVRQVEGQGGEAKLICIGRKGYDILKREYGGRILRHESLASSRGADFAQVQGIAGEVEGMFEEGGFDVCELLHARFESVLSQKPTALRLIPMRMEAESSADEGVAAAASASAEYEPWEEELLAALLPRALRAQMFQALLENAASEQGARMSAMDNATRNAGEMVERLTILYNRTRQAAITKELIEIISGSEALA